MNSSVLKAAAKKKAETCFSRALTAIDQLRREGRVISFSTVCEVGHVSRSYLYSNQYLRNTIVKMRETTIPEKENINQKIYMQAIEIQRLSREVDRLRKYEEQARYLMEENSKLKDQLRMAYKY